MGDEEELDPWDYGHTCIHAYDAKKKRSPCVGLSEAFTDYRLGAQHASG